MDYPLQLPEQMREYLRALHKEGGLTQSALGRLIGLSQGRIAEIELNPEAATRPRVWRVTFRALE